jgi:hypothetical protein
MFDRVKFRVSDYVASKAFFLKALEPRGVAVVSEGPTTYGVDEIRLALAKDGSSIAVTDKDVALGQTLTYTLEK